MANLAYNRAVSSADQQSVLGREVRRTASAFAYAVCSSMRQQKVPDQKEIARLEQRAAAF